MRLVHLSNGNSKLGNIVNVNLPPILSCVRNVPCQREGCYALKAWRMYPNVKRAWLENMDILEQNRQGYFNGIVDQLRAKRTETPLFRWHSSGDILDQSYLDNMAEVARLFPYTSFLAFTKRNNLNVSGLPDNLTVRFSYWPGYKPTIHKSFTQFAGLVGDDRLSGPICPGNCQKCPGKLCWRKALRDITFHKH